MNADEAQALQVALMAQIKAEIAAFPQSQGKVAEAVGIEPATLSRYIQGKRSMPVQTFLDLADVLGIPAADLMHMAQDRARRDAQRGGHTE